jgi:CubicO group peptidase (beta-lactamase class C family)
MPAFQMHDPYVTRDIRVKDLVIHRSGLPTFGGDRLWIGNSLSRKEIIRRIRYIEPTAPFRSRYQYQNLMYLVAGQLLPLVSGESWEHAIETRLLDPLGMDETTTSITDLDWNNVATPHEIVGGKMIPVAYDNVDAVAPAAAINSSAWDMTKWMRLHLNQGTFDGVQILNPETVQTLHSVQIPLSVSSFSREHFGTEFSGYGFGWSLSEYRGHKIVSHGGGLSGMISLQTLVPELRLGVMVLTNFAPNSLTAAVTYRVLDTFMGAEKTDWSEQFLNRRREGEKRRKTALKERQEKRIKGTQPSKSLDAYTGTYTEAVTGNVTLRMEKGKLVFDYNPRYLGDLEHWHYDTFLVTWRHPIFDMSPQSFLRFTLDDAGQITGFTVKFYYDVDFIKVEE